MQVSIPASFSRILTCVIPVMFLAGCIGEGDGPQRIPGTPAPPPPPDGFCDVINFETDCEPFEFTNFAGGTTVIIDNPDKRGLNTTDRVARMQKFDPGNGETFGGTKLQLDRTVDFSEGQVFTMKVWASRSVPVLFKLETDNPFVFQERTRNHSGSRAWEELCFDFTGSTAGLVPTDITVIFDVGVIGNAATDPENWTFFYDEITQVASCDGGGGIEPVNLPVNFEAAPESYNFGQENGFAGGVATVIANPDRSGLNTTAQTARMQKFAGEVFGGATLVLSDLINFGRGEAFNMKVWSARPVPVLFKLEDSVSGLPELGRESTVSHSGSGGWEQLCFDFSGSLAGFSSSSITFIFDLGAVGDAENNPDQWTFYFDEITQVASCSGGGANPGIIPDAVVYTSDPNVTVDLPPPVVDDLGSGSTFDFAFTGDADFNPALRVTSGGDAGGGVDGNIVLNGGFETGTFDGWQRFPNNGVLTIVTDNPSSGTFAANLLVPVREAGDSAADPLIKNANLQAGNLTPGATVTVSFDMRGTLSGAGGVVFAELFSELAGEGVSKAEILGNGPLEPTAAWTTYSFTTTLGADVGGGVTLQLKASCGAVVGCGVDVVIDNVSLVIGTGSGSSGTDTILADNHLGENIGIIALTGYAPGFAAGFETFNFKVKGLPANTIEVRFIEGGDTSRVYDVTTYAGSTSLGNGWYQLSIPLTDFAATIASNQGFALGPLGEQAAPFSFLLTDIGFSGTAGGGGGAGPGIIPDAVVFATDPGVTVDLPPPLIDNFGSGSTFNFAFTGDADFNPALQVTSGEEYGAGVHVGFVALFGYASGFAAGFETFNFKVKGLPEGTIEVKFIGGGDTSIVYDVTTYEGSTALGNGWYQLSIPLTDFAATIASNDGFLLGPLGAQAGPFSFLLTDIGFSGTAGGPDQGLGIDFDGPGPFIFDNFEGGVATVVANPDQSGLNTSAQVARMQKFAGATFAGSTLPLAGAVDFSAGTAFTMKVWSARPVPVTFKLEGLDQERVAQHTGGSVWQELCFDFTGSTAGVPADGITFIFDNGTAGDAENDPDNWTFYFDAIEQVSGCTAEPPPAGNFPTITFDDPTLTYTLTDFGGNVSVLTNDPAGGSNVVAQVLKPNTAEVWAGTTVSTLANLAVPAIPFTASETQMTVRVYSPDAGIPVMLKVEDAANNTLFVETLATTTVVNEWETLIFDFASPQPGSPPLNLANTYNKLSIFFNFGFTGAGDKIYYLDDIAFAGDSGGEVGVNFVVNGGFETGTFEGWETFPGGGIQAIVTDNPSAGVFAANLLVPVRGPGDSSVDNLIKNSNLEAGNLTPDAVVTVSFDMRGTLSGAGGVVFAELFSELAGEGVSKSEILSGGPLAPTSGWTTYSFTTTLGSDVGGGVTLQLKASCGPVEGCGVDVFFDNVSIVSGEGSGGGGGGESGGGIWDGGGIAVNGGFETGTFDGWETFPGGGIQSIVTDNPSSGTYAANLVVPVRTQGDPAVDNLIKNSNLEAGNLTPGAAVTVSFDMRGTLSGAGGVVFAEFFSELIGGGVSRAEIFSGGPLALTADWTKYTFNTTLGPDVSGGVTLQLKASCGPVEGCGVDVFFDNVSIVIN
jgi:hypothetical protein